MTLIHGECLEELKKLPENSVDAIVTDPPYGLSFMGKKWDYDVPSVEIWQECLRVLKPGGYLLSFAGTRTYHRMATGIEDAGFEIRDMIAWVYGSGFPKSLDISKAIDKNNGEIGRKLKFTEWMRSLGVTAKQLNDATGTFMGSHYLTEKEQPAIPTRELFEKMRPLLKEVPEWIDELVSRVEAEREVVGKSDKGSATGSIVTTGTGSLKKEFDITSAATDQAKQWEGWGTALKPALEPITVARKPIEGTVAENCLKFGVGGINIDECRIKSNEELGRNNNARTKGTSYVVQKETMRIDNSNGKRFPANLIHDGSDEVVELFPNDSQRFFYVAKASKSERNMGCEELEATRHADRKKEDGSGGDNPRNRTNTPKQNFHPTVKPIALMEYIVRLVSREGATVLDPFMGSGTTGIACKKLKRHFIGIEKEAEYIKIAESRISAQPITLL